MSDDFFSKSMSKKCPYCFVDIVGKHSIFANHTRWCEKNPRVIEIRESAATYSEQAIDRRFGEFKKYLVSCHLCSSEFYVNERELLFPSKDEYFCSRSCANTRPMSDVTKDKIREGTNKYISAQIEKDGGVSLRRNIRPSGFVPFCRDCMFCGTSFEIREFSRKKKKFCSVKCVSDERASKLRLTLSEWKIYRRDCQFKFSLNSYPDEFDFSLIESHGWYKAKNHGNNLNGVSRDHMVSIRYGFDNGIDEKVISHPANCKLLQHGMNSSKHSKCSITIDELLLRIEEWDKKYGKFI